MLTGRQVLLGLILAVSGVIAWWRLGPEVPDERPPSTTERRPAYIIDAFSFTTMSEAGTPDRRLVADRLRHFADDESNELDYPDLVLFADDGPPWRIRAEQGWVSGDKTLVILRTNVTVDRAAGESSRAVHLETEELHVYPKRDYAETRRPVKVASESEWLTSTGMQAWLTDRLRARFEGRAHLLVGPGGP